MSVREVIDRAGALAGRAVPVVEGPRRPGDPAVLVASSRRIREELGWSPRSSDLTTILRTALGWARSRPGGWGG